MKLREKKVFGQRSVGEVLRDGRKKIFLVFEGTKTEEIYFRALQEKSNSSISSVFANEQDINLVPIVKNYSDARSSNPLNIIERLQLNVDESRSGTWSYYTLLDAIMVVLEEISSISDAERNLYYKMMLEVCKEKYHGWLEMDVVDFNAVAKELIDAIPYCMNWEYVLENIPQLLSFVSISYEYGFDKIYCIFDRDKKSFTEKQIRYVIDVCNKNDFCLCISNPCFELWLLLHLEQAEMLDILALKENNIVAQRKTYAEQMLNKAMKRYGFNYEKNNYNTELFMDRIQNAIKEEKKLSEDINELIDNVGCNIGVTLFSELKLDSR